MLPSRYSLSFCLTKQNDILVCRGKIKHLNGPTHLSRHYRGSVPKILQTNLLRYFVAAIQREILNVSMSRMWKTRQHIWSDFWVCAGWLASRWTETEFLVGRNMMKNKMYSLSMPRVMMTIIKVFYNHIKDEITSRKLLNLTS